jgi:O-succinylhomoserine sulfhydrylase
MSHQASTLAVRTGQYQDLSDAHGEPIALTSAYVFRSASDAAAKFSGLVPGNVYSRFTNPTVRAFEQRLAALEGAQDGVAFASGMAAIAGIAHACLEAGHNIVCSRDVFGSTLAAFRRYFGKLGIEVRVVELTQTEAWRAAIDSRTRLVFLETPSNPMQLVGDIGAIARIAHAEDALLAVDNTMLTSMFQRPLALGADLVVHSAGKYIDGQGRCIGGAVLGSEALMSELRGVTRTLGSCLGAMNAWLLLKGMETLELRMKAIEQSTARIASWASAHRRVGSVHYTGSPDHPQAALARRQQSGHGGVLSLEVGTCREDAWRVIDALGLISIATNMGDTRSMVTHPATTTHCRLSAEERRQAGIGDNLVRLSVGLESSDDLLADLEQALSRLAPCDESEPTTVPGPLEPAPCRPC